MTRAEGHPEFLPGSDEWARRQVATFSSRRGQYESLAETLLSVLSCYSAKHAPFAIVQARAKTVPSFAGKIRRRSKQTADPVTEFTDLCGARLILHTESDVRRAVAFIEGHFDIDWANTNDANRRLGPSEFGYRSTHYIVSFRRPSETRAGFPSHDVPVTVPDEIYEMPNQRSEIQVRTLVQHAWADVTHDAAYKGGFRLSEVWQRRLARLAALLEEADGGFSNVVDGLREYMTSYGSYMTADELRGAIAEQKFVLEQDPADLTVVRRLGSLALALGDWDAAIEILDAGEGDSPRADDPAILRDLGVALCRKNAGRPESAEYARGQACLSRSVQMAPDVSALCALAETHVDADPGEALRLLLEARTVDPSDPDALQDYLECEIPMSRNHDVLLAVRPDFAGALERCRRLAEADVDLIKSFFHLGALHLLAGHPYDALADYAKAVSLSDTEHALDRAELTLDRVGPVAERIPGHEWARRFLFLAHAAKFPGAGRSARLKELGSEAVSSIRAPVVLLAGGSDSMTEQQVAHYRESLLGGFRAQRVTLLSGGTTAGVSGLAGDLGEACSGRVSTIGYVPHRIESTATVDRDTSRYGLIVTTQGDGFSPLELLQGWTDLLAAGIAPGDVRLLGLGGGDISRLEYRVALALGATVGLIAGSGREAAAIFKDPDWAGHPRLLELPDDPATIGHFVGAHGPTMDEAVRERLAADIHERYRQDALSRARHVDPAVMPWNELREDLKESNRDQAKDIPRKLRLIGCTVEAVTGRSVQVFNFGDEEVEVLAEAEHGRWNVERLLSGWRTAAQKDSAAKLTPYLVSWVDLPDDVKQWDRDAVQAWPAQLARLGLEIRRRGDAVESGA